jgi:hypothetical protein
MEFWLSKPFSRTFLFLRWNSGYQEAFLMNFSFFHNGILAIRKPFSRTFLFFTMEFWLSGSLSCELFFFSRRNSVCQEALLTNFSFFTMEFCKYAIWGKTLFIYISQRVFT